MAFDHVALDFFLRFLATPAPARSEAPAADAFEAYAATFARTERDAFGNCFARRGSGGGPRVALCGHLDEVGLAITGIDPGGFLRFTTIGSWDPSVLVGQRVLVRGADGAQVEGVVGRPGIHLLRATGAEQHAPDPADLWIDIAVRDEREAHALIEIGTTAVLAGEPRIVRDHVLARSLDNRLGTFVALEALRALPDDVPGEVVVVATVHEEVGGAGARAAAASLGADALVVIDLSPSSDTPAGHPIHTLELGAGPGLNSGPFNTASLVDELRDVAREQSIAIQQRQLPRKSSTDVDRFADELPDTPCALLSIPSRYAHTPGELASLPDVVAAIDLLTAWCLRRTAQPASAARG